MTLTVAIPSYNKEKYIDRCIKSVLAEKEYIDEIILIDNYSSDNTFELAKKYELQIRCIKNDYNLGMAGNWNKCIDLCKTDLLMILHADDELLPGSIKKYLDFFENHPDVGIVHADFFFVKDGDLKTKQYTKVDDREIRKAGVEALEMPMGYVCSTLMVKKSVYNDVGYYMKSDSSDAEMILRIASKYDRGYLNMPTAIVHVNLDSFCKASFRDREIKEIEADLLSLGEKIDSYLSKESRDKRKKSARSAMAGVFFKVFVVNLKAGQYRKAFQALGLVIFKYRGFFIIFVTIYGYLKYRWHLRRLRVLNG